MAQITKFQATGIRSSFPIFGLLVILLPAVISQGGIKYPATIQTKGITSGMAEVDLRYYDNYDQIYFNYDAAFEMGSATKITIQGSTLDGEKQIANTQLPGEPFTRIINQKVTKSKDEKGIHLTVFIETTLKLAEGKEKYGKSSIGVRVAPGRRGAHYWDIKHEIYNNYEAEKEGELCLGCDVDENENQVDPGFYSTTPAPEYEPGRPYKCNWEVNDQPSQNFYRADVVSDGTTVRGEYRVLLPDGRTQIVTYTSDWLNGYMPVVKYE